MRLKSKGVEMRKRKLSAASRRRSASRKKSADSRSRKSSSEDSKSSKSSGGMPRLATRMTILTKGTPRLTSSLKSGKRRALSRSILATVGILGRSTLGTTHLP